ncbi:ABC transporter ATP-binding protein [Lapidilactobacillus achengensis]|uniref:ABC transporter ATP-binding protein n=1 Tax=Lapidilactobacillus achengensis TaxID=2486000 RepID=A0ABW1URK3_9LACO|nr:ABC transporter ATP-binding protein [Lapidilactobacillus achengensis]
MYETLKLFKYEKKLTLLTIVLSIAMALSSVGSSVTLAPLTDRLIARDLSGVTYWLLLTIAFWGVTLALNYANSILQEQIIRKITNQLRVQITDGLNDMSLTDYRQSDHSEYVSWLTNDLDLIKANGLQNFFELISNFSTLIFSIGALFFYHYSLAVIAIILGVLTMLIPNFFGTFMERETNRLSAANSKFLTKIEDLFGGFSVFLTHNIGHILTANVNEESDQQGATNVKYVRNTGFIELIIGLISVLAQMVMLGLTCYLAIKGYFSVGVISSSGQLSGIVFSRLTSVIHGIFRMKTVNAITKKDIKPQSQHSTPSKIDFERALTLEHLNFGYTDAKDVIKDFSYQFVKGGKYAIVGKSGTGKSTLIKLLSGRLENYRGTIKIDDAELKSVNPHDIYDVIELVEQKPYIFNESVGENISLGVKKSPTMLEKIAEFLHLNEFTSLKAMMSEHGSNLSGGQRQRLALARAMAFSKPILIIDEVTAGIDAEGSQQIEDALLADENLTVIMITHTLSDKTRQQLTGLVELGDEQRAATLI